MNLVLAIFEYQKSEKKSYFKKIKELRLIYLENADYRKKKMVRVKMTSRRTGTGPRKTIIPDVAEDASRTTSRTVSEENVRYEEVSTPRRSGRLQTKNMVSTPDPKTTKKRKSPLKEVRLTTMILVWNMKRSLVYRGFTLRSGFWEK